MSNKTTNFLIVIIGIVLFSASSWIADSSFINTTKSFFEITGLVTIIGAMLVMFSIINITSIIFSKAFNENYSVRK